MSATADAETEQERKDRIFRQQRERRTNRQYHKDNRAWLRNAKRDARQRDAKLRSERNNRAAYQQEKRDTYSRIRAYLSPCRGIEFPKLRPTEKDACDCYHSVLELKRNCKTYPTSWGCTFLNENLQYGGTSVQNAARGKCGSFSKVIDDHYRKPPPARPSRSQPKRKRVTRRARRRRPARRHDGYMSPPKHKQYCDSDPTSRSCQKYTQHLIANRRMNESMKWRRSYCTRLHWKVQDWKKPGARRPNRATKNRARRALLGECGNYRPGGRYNRNATRRPATSATRRSRTTAKGQSTRTRASRSSSSRYVTGKTRRRHKVSAAKPDRKAPPRPAPRVRRSSYPTSQLFKSRTSFLSPAGKRELELWAEHLRNDGRQSKFEIAVYADSTGEGKRTQRLTVWRASAIKRFLVRKGVPAARLATKGHGSGGPAPKPGMPRARVEFRER